MIGLLLTAGAALVTAFVLAPAALLEPTFGAYNNDATRQDALGRALADYWRSGTAAFPADLTTLVDYWFQWHAIKVVISTASVVVFALLATALWRRYLRFRPWLAVAATAATVSTVLATGVLVLNIQATAVPLVALLPLLPGRTTDGQLAQTVSEMREALAAPASPHAGSPALTALLGEVERYHWVTVAVAATLMVAAALASAHVWKRRVGGDLSARVKFMHSTLGVITALTACLLLLMAVASALSALDPATWLLGVIGAGPTATAGSVPS
ncbi:hypothetical protein ADL15_45470 [Actinoplanes awajinensis subsp. mycoplanecinus]|uniref:Uncharacterized protein n=1 Tax=Actinoplanes awajinensis subsp. mycoplanecinus TaxID=135947 RepID=A0A101JAX7_9ACTN|nr:hypothetical protein ADL15_45470 [Actinoplanes awajinensis subsp. mycoplanecinus]